MIRIEYAPKHAEIEKAHHLFEAYASSLNFDLSFQGFEEELRNLPGEYVSPTGCLLLAYHGTEVAGCIALRKIEDGICEMKRLYVRPNYRTHGIGRMLSGAVIAEARKMGYKKMRLDTLPSMKTARALYESMGFRMIPAYYHNPIPGTVYLELKLNPKVA